MNIIKESFGNNLVIPLGINTLCPRCTIAMIALAGSFKSISVVSANVVGTFASIIRPWPRSTVASISTSVSIRLFLISFIAASVGEED